MYLIWKILPVWFIWSTPFCVPDLENIVHLVQFSPFFKSRSKTSVLQIFNMKKWKPNWLKLPKMHPRQKLWNLRSFNGILQNLMRLSLPYVAKVCFKCMTAIDSFNISEKLHFQIFEFSRQKCFLLYKPARAYKEHYFPLRKNSKENNVIFTWVQKNKKNYCSSSINRD